MSEGTYGEAPVLACGCVGLCTCFSEPVRGEGVRGEGVRGEGLWLTQDANGTQYLWTGSAWVDPNSAEGQAAQADPTNYDAGASVQSAEGYWYSYDANGNQYLWTTGGWMSTTAVDANPSTTVVGGPSPGVSDAGGYTTTPGSTVIGPPTAGDSTIDLLEQAYATGDQSAIDAVTMYIETQENMNEIWLNPGGNPDQPISEDWDQDSTPDSTDYDPYDSSVQDAADVPSDTDY